MVELLAAMYMVCTMSMTDPDISGPEISGMFPREAITQQEKKKEQPDNINYLEELKKLGYYKKTFRDDKLNIRMAVIHFQTDNNISITGRWDDQSMESLKKQLKDGEFKYLDTVEKTPTEGKWLVINKSKRTITLYEGSTVSKKYPVAVGNPATLTPSGKFHIACKIVNPAWGGGGYAKPVAGGAPNNPLGKKWMGLSINGGGDYGIHGNINAYSIGTYASHGCIRMDNTDVEALFKTIEVNTPVWIGDEAELNKWGVKQPVFKD